MKILFTFLTYGKDVFGGVEKSVYNLIEGLRLNGVESIVFTGKRYMKNKPVNHKIYYSNYLIHNFDTSQINEQILDNYKKYNKQIRNELISIIKKESPDYILVIDHIWGIIPYVDVFSEISCPIGIVFHMLHRSDLIKNSFNYPFSHFFCVSSFIKDNIQEYNISNKKLDILPNSISLDFFKNRKNNIGVNNLFCNARISCGKGVEQLIEAFKLLLKYYPDCRLFLCNGDFHFMKKYDFSEVIDSINSKHKEKKIILLPNIPWDNISRVLRNMDIVILPSEMETFGLAALEAIASKTPIITTKNGNLPNLLKNSAYYLENNSIDEIFKMIYNIISKPISETKINEGKKIAEEYLNNKVAYKLIMKIATNYERK